MHFCSITYYSIFSFYAYISHPPPTSTLFPYTTLFRSQDAARIQGAVQCYDPRRRNPHRARPDLPDFVDDGDRQQNQRSEEHTSELQSHSDLVCCLLLEKKNNKKKMKSINPRDDTSQDK